MIRRLFPIVAAGALLTGCIDLAPKYRQPVQPTPAAFPSGPAYAVAKQAEPVVPWRDFFVDPKLRALIDEALVNNRDLRIAVANILTARGQYQVQRSDLFPKLNAQASATYGQYPLGVAAVQSGATGGSTGGAAAGGGAVATTGGSGVYNERLYSANGAVTAFQLDLFGKQRNLTRQAFEQYLSTRAARDAAQITLISEVATDALTLGSDRALLEVSKEALVNGDATLAITRARFRGGVASELDVFQAETFSQQARSDVARLTTQVAQDRNALELVVGAPVADADLPADVEGPGVAIAKLPAGLPSSVLLARPDVVQAEDVLKGANANIGAARAAFFPDISLTGSGGVTSLALSTLFRSAAETWTFVPSISQPIFDFGQNKGNLNIAKGDRDADLAQYEKTVQTAFREVADALARRGTIDEQLAAEQALTAAAAGNLKLSTARYQSGADTYLNELVAQRTLYSAQQTLIATQLTLATNLVTLYTALGGGVR
jgi:multidrug efflux system outer membrane protein